MDNFLFRNGEPKPSRRRSSKAPWISRGWFEGVSGRREGYMLDVDTTAVEWATAYAKSVGAEAYFETQVRRDNSEHRTVLRLVMPARSPEPMS